MTGCNYVLYVLFKHAPHWDHHFMTWNYGEGAIFAAPLIFGTNE